jgi:hypothetical protein
MEMLNLVLSSLIGGGVATALIIYFGRTWFEARLKAAIDFEYKKSFDLFQRQQNQKEKIEMVAELLAEYMRTPANEPVPRDQRVLLNKLSLRSSLWLPQDLALEIAKRLQNKPDALSPFELTLLARRKLTDDSSLTAEHVTIWGFEKEKPS